MTSDALLSGKIVSLITSPQIVVQPALKLRDDNKIVSIKRYDVRRAKRWYIAAWARYGPRSACAGRWQLTCLPIYIS